MTARAEPIVLLLFGLAVPLVLGSSLLIFNDGDVRWHIAAGQWMLNHHALPKADPFSFSFAGAPWVTFEWGSQLIFGAAHRLAGFGGVAAVVSLALIALHLIVAFEARRHVGPWGVAGTIVLLDLTLVPMMLARPHLLAWPLLAGWTVLLLRYRDQGRAPPLAMAGLIVLWANLHGSWAIGIVIAAFVALDHVIERRWDRALVGRWLGFGLLATAAALVTPNGIEGFRHPLTIASLDLLPLIVEWRPSDPQRTPFFFVALGVAVGLLWWRGVRLRPVIALLIVLLVAMALQQMRHQAVLAIVAAIVLPAAVSRGTRRALLKPGQLRPALGVGALAVAALLAFRAANLLEPAENGANPSTAIAAVPSDLRSRPMLNGYGFGGPLILAGFKVFIDGRADMYGDEFTHRFKGITDGDSAEFERAVERYGIAWTILPPRHDKLIATLDRDPRWMRVHSDPVSVIHRRVAD